MSKITYANKVALNENADIPNVNKVTDDDMNEIKTVVNNNDDELITINTKVINITGQILWTNPSSSSSFAEQTITLSSGNYDFYEIYCVYSNTSGSHYANGFKTIKGKGLVISENGYGTDLSVRRKVDYTDATHLLISSAFGGANIDNGYLIPIYVIGYKTGTFN